MVAIGISLLFIYFTPSRRQSAKNRRMAISTLLGANGNLMTLNSFIASPYLKQGSISHLNHYLSKDPGREEFRRASDQKYAEDYLAAIATEIEMYRKAYTDYSMEWTPDFLATTRALFEEVKQDVLDIAGIPERQIYGTNSAPSVLSFPDRIEQAIKDFSALWEPPGATLQAYRPDKQLVRDYLIGNRRFNKAMRRIDYAWRALVATLYNLSKDSTWQLAVSFDPSLGIELDELTIAALSGDIYRCSQDIMAAVQETDRLSNTPYTPGIRWKPEFSIYKNIPELTGQTQDATTTFFFVKINILYISQDVKTQTWLNQRKDWLSNYFQSYFSDMPSERFISFKTNDETAANWALAMLKARMIHPLNKDISGLLNFSPKMIGIRELAFARIMLVSDV